MSDNKKWIRLNVGGKIFLTRKGTLKTESRSKLANLDDDPETERDESGAILLDRDPELFKIILCYLRTKNIVMSKHICLDVLTDEAILWGLGSLVSVLNELKASNIPKKMSRVYRIMSMTLQDVVSTLSEMCEGWKFEQVFSLIIEIS
ncbi:hypothetical protein MXB_2122 [Myxobolus squamalis]|nr:hypothetical protein MXB_2122 [Myxobolus squamalis]